MIADNTQKTKICRWEKNLLNRQQYQTDILARRPKTRNPPGDQRLDTDRHPRKPTDCALDPE